MQKSGIKIVSVTAAVAAVTALSGCTGSPGNTAASSTTAAPTSTAAAGPTYTQADRANPSTLHFAGLRNVRYCEVFLINPGTDATQVFNTTGANECPADKWDSLDAAKVASEKGSQALFKNGPRYWVLDQLTQPGTKQMDSFNGIDAKWWGATTISGTGGASASPPYTEALVNRPGSEWFYNAGTVVNELVDPGGKTYVMQAYSQIVNSKLTIDDLPNLAYSLKLPSGWKYVTRVLTQNLTTKTDPDGIAHVIQDDLQNSYQLITTG